MTRSKWLIALAMQLALISPVEAAQPPAAPDEPLRVFLQGSSSAGLTALVTGQGGSITHDLHIINAVGAKLTREQLDKVLESPEIIRYFEDLSVSEKPQDTPAEQKKECDVGGAVELEIGNAGFGWRLFNKRTTPALLEQVKLSWPRQMGTIQRMTLDGTDLGPPPDSNDAGGPALVEFGGTTGRPMPALNGIQTLEVRFQSATDRPLLQRDFTLEAKFSGDCSTKLIPGHDDNHENFHYNAAAGVEALHLNGVTGRGITIAVVDSGLWEHPALTNDTSGKPRLLAKYDAIANVTGKEVFDASGHGTHMTSIIAHNGPVTRDGVPTGVFKGVAPDVNLVSVKAFDVAGRGDLLDIVRAIQWVVDNRETYNIRVLNLSFTATPRWHYWLDPLNQAVMQAWASGITVIAAAGNEGPDPMTIGSPGNLPFVITVGAVTDSWTPLDKDDDYIPDFSSRGPTPDAHIKPDVVAPGGHLTGLTRPGSGLTLDHPDYVLRTGEFVMSGSSQATALVSGVAALLLQLEPDLRPEDIKCKLMTSAEPAINRDGLLAYSPFQQGHGYINATRAVTLGQRGCGNAGMDIQQELTGTSHTQGPAITKEDGTASLPGLDAMLSPETPEKGLSSTRKWGVKAHIERHDPPIPNAEMPPGTHPFDWEGLYQQERETIENLSRTPLQQPSSTN